MNPVIFDMHALAAQHAVLDQAAEQTQDLFDKLMASLRELPLSSNAELAEEVLDRAAAYDESQPSFAADLRAAAMSEDEAALA